MSCAFAGLPSREGRRHNPARFGCPPVGDAGAPPGRRNRWGTRGPGRHYPAGAGRHSEEGFMRKLLLATAAVVGASMGMTGFAAAQAPQPYTLNGTVVSPRSPGHASTYGNNNYLNGTATKGPVANPGPGQMVVHLGFLVLSEATASWTSVDSAVPGTKVNPLGLQTYVRIYPGVDAMAANGLRYGAAVEIRQNFFGNTGATASSGSDRRDCQFGRHWPEHRADPLRAARVRLPGRRQSRCPPRRRDGRRDRHLRRRRGHHWCVPLAQRHDRRRRPAGCRRCQRPCGRLDASLFRRTERQRIRHREDLLRQPVVLRV